MEKLREFMEIHKEYKSPGLTLEILSDMLGVNRNKLSHAINCTSDKNFNQFINELRVREVILMMNIPKYSRSSMEELMEEVGFHSRTTFYDAFKKATGLTPAQYWKSRKVKYED